MATSKKPPHAGHRAGSSHVVPSAAGASSPTLPVAEIFRGRNVFILGSTGFVGKVLLSLLLDRFPDIGRAYVMVRRGSGTDSETRFWQSVVTSPAFEPLRSKYQGREGLAAFLKEKVRVVDGDITEKNLGLSEEDAQRVAQDIDVLINSSGRVTFNPPLESALKTNVDGTRNVIAFAKRMKRPALIHTSTCFVAGNRSGEVWESEELDGYFPRRQDLPGTQFSVEQEMTDSEHGATRIRQLADDAQVLAQLRKLARERLREENRDPDDEGALRLAVARQRKEWIRAELTQQGIERAREWGWPNIYTYTKSMGDQLVARETGIVRAIVRPAIVESAVAYPFRGWNEGFTTSAPLVYLALKGQNVLPVSSQKLILDVVPVDHVAAAMLMVAAQAIVGEPKLVYQLSSGDLNPLYIDRVVTLTGLYKRKRFQDKETGNRFINELAARMEFRPITQEEYEARSIPMVNRLVQRTSKALGKIRPSWGGGRFTEFVDRAKKQVDEVERITDEASKNIELFRPFIFDNRYVFRADNIRALRDRMGADGQALLPWGPENLDWYDYWMNIHFPGLQRWVLPELDQTYAARPKQVYSYHDLLELFDTTTKLHATRVAMRIERGKREEIYNYADLQELATRIGVFLIGEEIAAGERVLLFAKNGPEWSMAYFGVLKAGATVVPVGYESTVAEIVNIARASGAVGILIGDDLHDKRSDLKRALREASLTTKIWPFATAFELPDLAVEQERAKALHKRVNPDTLASLIFTSGTTGKPKGVMLTHRNFTFMVSELSKVFEFGVSDGMLSVLPLHHTFEFSTGLLVPLAHGAQITYLTELTGELIASTLKKGHVTAIVGVPALWDLMRRRVLQRFSDKSPLLETAMKGLMAANYELRSRTKLDLGLFFFLPIHEGFGGRIRYLISGGSALPSEVMKTFYGMGFSFFEGYGLTETAPVLTVTSPKKKPMVGSVGQPLPGLEVKIDAPDGAGVGEVIARGRNVMAGYWEDQPGTDAAIVDGWFRTGDLGRFDENGNLFLVGRSKEIIVDSNGKNVYPDEIEDLYRDCKFIKDLSVVGLPDGSAEHVVCAVQAAYDADATLTHADVAARIDEHFRKVSADLPFWKRVKTVHIWDGELPRTSTRKVKRREVVAELTRLAQKSAETPTVALDSVREGTSVAWLADLVATVSGRQRGDVHPNSRFDQLGFDSLMYAELSGALETAGVTIPDGFDVTAIADVTQLHDALTRGRVGAVMERAGRQRSQAAAPSDEIQVPSTVARAGKRGLALAQKLFYKGVLHTDVRGANHIPQHTNFLVAANHCSHLDMGLIKVALGPAGRDITSLAAADYFFRNKYRRAYFSHFTNLVPMERSGSIRRSMDTAQEVLRQGRSMVVFPEGTRSLNGELADFLPSLGYLALRAEVGILPAFIAGTFDALPKGAAIPKARALGVAFGPFLSIERLKEMTEGLSSQEAWRLAAAYVQRIVENLRDGVPNPVDSEAIRAAWDGHRLGVIELKRGSNGPRRLLRSVP